MLIHIVPTFFSSCFSPRLHSLLIQPWGLLLTDGKEITTRKPFPNKRYSVACRKKGKKAIQGLLFKTAEKVRNFWTYSIWVEDQSFVSMHRVNYEIIDEDFSAASDDVSLWHATMGNNWELEWSRRVPEYMENQPWDYRPCMCWHGDDSLVLKNAIDFLDNSHVGLIAERVQNIRIHTIEPERINDELLNWRAPKPEEAFVASSEPDWGYEEEEDAEESLGCLWTDKHGYDPTNWPLPDGQPLKWEEWAQEVSNEAMRQGYQPREDFFPWTEEDIKWAAGTCWVEDWVTGRTPKETIDQNSGEPVEGDAVPF